MVENRLFLESPPFFYKKQNQCTFPTRRYPPSSSFIQTIFPAICGTSPGNCKTGSRINVAVGTSKISVCRSPIHRLCFCYSFAIYNIEVKRESNRTPSSHILLLLPLCMPCRSVYKDIITVFIFFSSWGLSFESYLYN